MSKFSTLLTTLGLGAGLMYFYDPTRGRRRRAQVRDRVISLRNRSDDAIEVAVRDLRNRTRGVLAEAMARVSDEGAPDEQVAERVRAALGRVMQYGTPIEVAVDGGQVRLTGMVHPDDAERVVKKAAHVLGVRGVDNQMEVVMDPQRLKGFSPRRINANQDMWTPSTRLLTGVGGGLLTLYGRMRRGIVGSALSMAGMGLMARGISNVELKTLLGMSGERQAVRVAKEITLDAPVEEVFSFWRNLENLPRFMNHLNEVRDLGSGRSHWVAVGPAGSPVEWDAIITREIPNELLEWESVAGSPVQTAGMVRFRHNPMGGPSGGTHLIVRMGYTPPAGALGHAVASLMGVDPKRAMDEDLVRLKSLFETGKTTVGGQTMTRNDMPGQPFAGEM